MQRSCRKIRAIPSVRPRGDETPPLKAVVHVRECRPGGGLRQTFSRFVRRESLFPASANRNRDHSISRHGSLEFARALSLCARANDVPAIAGTSPPRRTGGGSAPCRRIARPRPLPP